MRDKRWNLSWRIGVWLKKVHCLNEMGKLFKKKYYRQRTFMVFTFILNINQDW